MYLSWVRSPERRSNCMETNPHIVSRKIREDLRRYGWTVLSTLYHDVDFIHTLGLHWSYQHPDFEVLGLPEALGTALLNELAQRVKNGQRVRSGDLLEDVAEDVALWVTANPLDPEGTPLLNGRLRIIWPDDEGHYPWDADCEPRCRTQLLFPDSTMPNREELEAQALSQFALHA